MKKINVSDLDILAPNLVSGEKLLLSGVIITARDSAHKRFVELISISDTTYPSTFKTINSKLIYYCGPTPARPGLPIGSCGPTTSGRMDKYAPILIEKGFRYMMGKGQRSMEVLESIKKHKGLYLIAIGGAGALYGRCVLNAKCIAYPDLGTEAVYELTIVDFPCYVAIDTNGVKI